MKASRQDKASMREAKELVAFYEKRGSNWLSALEFTLRKASGTWPERKTFGGRRNG